jgi:phosphoesterase RecJ-like protein
MSEALYTGIITDTGSFRYPRTTEETFLCCAELVRQGADPVGIYERIYNENSINKIRLMAKYLESFEFYYGDRLGLGILSAEDFKETQADQTDIEGFSSIMMSIQGIVMSIMLVELPHSIKISLRSKGEIKVNEIAKEFGGGGHKNAAGASYFKGDISELKTKVLSVAKGYLN